MSAAPGVALQEKRSHLRAAVEIPVSCEQSHGPPVSGIARDIGIGGIFVESTELLPFGTELVIVAWLPRTRAALRLPGIVRWSKSKGFGVQFGLLGARETHAISMLLER